MLYCATRTALPALVALAAACATTTRVDRASEEQRIRELSQQASRALESKDATTFVNFYADDAILMLATGWTDRAWESEKLYEMNPYLAQDAAETLAEASPSALGLDFAVDDTRPWPNHTILLGVGVLLIENLMRLPELPRDGFDVMAFPLRLVGENGGPARVVVELGR